MTSHPIATRVGVDAPDTSSGDGETAARARRGWYAAAALIGVHVVLAWLLRAPAITTANDDAVYALLARAVRALNYRELYTPGAPVHSQYPPGYPSFLALTETLFGEHLDVMLAAGILASAAALAIFFATVRQLWSERLALGALALAAINPALLSLAGLVRSESLFLVLSVLALAAAARRPVSRGSLFLAAFATIAAALTRSVGVTLVAAVWLVWMGERRYRAATIFAVAAALTVGGWLAWTVRAPTQIVGRSYVADAALGSRGARHGVVGSVARRAAANIRSYGAEKVPQVIPFPTVKGTTVDNWFWVVMTLVLGAMGAAGLWKRWRVAAVFVGCYGLLLALWPYTSERFLAPQLPFFLLIVLCGASALARRWRAAPAPLLPLALGLAIGATSVARDAASLGEVSGCDRASATRSAGCFSPDQRGTIAAAMYAGQHTPEDAVVFTAKEGTLGYYAHRRALLLGPALKMDSTRLLAYLLEKRVGFILLGHTQYAEPPFAAQLAGICGHLRVAGEFPPHTYLLQVGAAAPSEASGTACQAIGHYLRSTTEPTENLFW